MAKKMHKRTLKKTSTSRKHKKMSKKNIKKQIVNLLIKNLKPEKVLKKYSPPTMKFAQEFLDKTRKRIIAKKGKKTKSKKSKSRNNKRR
jgi:hypothetical protein